MIENSERGITINKALAWTMLVSVTGLIWWGGGTLPAMFFPTGTSITARVCDRLLRRGEWLPARP